MLFFFRHSYNINIRDLYGLIVKAIIELPMRDESSQEGQQLLTEMKKVRKRLYEYLFAVQIYYNLPKYHNVSQLINPPILPLPQL